MNIHSVNKDIVVRLKWGETEYHGRLVSSDSYMNIQLTNAQEFIDQKFTSDLGQILIRCVRFSYHIITRERNSAPFIHWIELNVWLIQV